MAGMIIYIISMYESLKGHVASLLVVNKFEIKNIRFDSLVGENENCL